MPPRTGPVDRRVLERMCAALEHRGPDSRGLFVDRERRPRDPAPSGRRPRNRRSADLQRGRLGRRRAQRRDLQLPGAPRASCGTRGHRFATEGDTEVIVHLYEEYGVDCVRRLHGMFAFALWDTRRRRLLLARDRIGKKPLFYSATDGGLAFASELRALIEDPNVPRGRWTPRAIDCFLAYGYVPAPLSIFSGVREAAAGAHARVRAAAGRASIGTGGSTTRASSTVGRPARAPRTDSRASPCRDAAADDRRRAAGRLPVRRHRFLGRGRPRWRRPAATPVKTFSIGFDSDAFNELEHARRIAELFGTDHHEFVVRPDAIEIVPKIVRQYGEPFADASAIPCFYLSELTRRQVTVALNGDGGDESFGGYTRYVANRLGRPPGWHARAAAPRRSRLGPKQARRRRGDERLEQGAAADGGARADPGRRATSGTCPGSTTRAELGFTPKSSRRSSRPAGSAEVISRHVAGGIG